MSPLPPQIFGSSLEEMQARMLRWAYGLESKMPPIRPDDPEEEERHFREVIEETKRRRAAGEPLFDDLFDEF